MDAAKQLIAQGSDSRLNDSIPLGDIRDTSDRNVMSEAAERHSVRNSTGLVARCTKTSFGRIGVTEASRASAIYEVRQRTTVSSSRRFKLLIRDSSVSVLLSLSLRLSWIVIWTYDKVCDMMRLQLERESLAQTNFLMARSRHEP